MNDLVREYNPAIRGWLQYYSRFYPSALHPFLHHLNRVLVRWAQPIQEAQTPQATSRTLAEAGGETRTPPVYPLAKKTTYAEVGDPDESRGSRPVLGEPRRAILRGYSLSVFYQIRCEFDEAYRYHGCWLTHAGALAYLIQNATKFHHPVIYVNHSTDHVLE